jgi:hypothetical protein
MERVVVDIETRKFAMLTCSVSLTECLGNFNAGVYDLSNLSAHVFSVVYNNVVY